jgi:preprotein translocase subunit SecG
MLSTLAAQFMNVTATLAFQWPGWAVGALIAMFLFVCVIMVLTVLIQKPQGGGLASAFGGGVSAGQTAFGTKTGDALTVFTIAVFVAYLGLAIILNYATQPYVLPAQGDVIESGDPAGGPPGETPADTSGAPLTPAVNPVAVPVESLTPANPTNPAEGTAPATLPATVPPVAPATTDPVPAPAPAPTPAPGM